MTLVTSLRFIKRLLVYIRTSDRRLLAHELLNYKPYYKLHGSFVWQRFNEQRFEHSEVIFQLSSYNIYSLPLAFDAFWQLYL